MRIGQRIIICYCSGIDSGKRGTIIDPKEIPTKQTGGGIIPDLPGYYKPADWKKEYAIRFDDGRLGTMYKTRCTRLIICPECKKEMPKMRRNAADECEEDHYGDLCGSCGWFNRGCSGSPHCPADQGGCDNPFVNIEQAERCWKENKCPGYVKS